MSFLRQKFFTEKGFNLVKTYTIPRTSIGLDNYASYKDYDDSYWRIGYGSKEINDHLLNSKDRATKKEIDKQFYIDLQKFAENLNNYVFVSLNTNKRAALLSFAHSIGIQSFKTCRLLELINSYASKTKIIKEWSPFINTIWRSGGELMISRRRTELNMFFAPDKEIPTLHPHKCTAKVCLLNLVETYNGSANQIKGIEYLEKKFKQLDPSGEVLRQFFRYWNQKPTGLGFPQPPKVDP